MKMSIRMNAWVGSIALTMAALGVACDSSSSSDEDTGSASLTSATTMTSAGSDDTSGGSMTSDGTGTVGDSADTGMAETGADTGIEPDPMNVIDDLDDGDALIRAAGGRQGAWYVYNDMTAGATQTPPEAEPFAPAEGGPADSLFMAQTTGSGFAEWGAGMGVDLNNEGDDMGGDGVRMTYDASAFQGIVFWARGNTPIRLKVLVEAIIPVAQNGTCEVECEDSHGAIVPLTEEWKQYQISFAELVQEGWGTTAAFDASTLMSIQFQVAADTEFDYSVDELAFY